MLIKQLILSFKRYYPLLIIYVLLILIFYRWFGAGSFANGDTSYLSIDNIKAVYAPYLWKNFHDLGIFYTETPFILISYIAALPSNLFNLGFNSFSIKFLFFYPYLFLAPLGSYLLVNHLTKSKLASFWAGLIYTLTTPILMVFAQGHLYLLVPPTFLPFLFLLLIKYFDSTKNNTIYLYFINLILILISIYEFRVLYITFIWMTVYLLYELIINGYKNIKKLLAVFISTICISLLFNSFWLLPTLFSSESLQTNAILNRPLFGSNFLTVLNPIALFHPYWTFSEIKIFTSQNVSFIFLIMPILAILGLILTKEKKYPLFFLLLLVIGITLTKGTNEPFGYLYNVIFEYVPGFSLFREPTKFFYAIAISYAVLIGYYIAALQTKINKKIYLNVTILLLLIYVFILAKPIFTGEAKTIFIPIETRDKDYELLRDYLKKNNKEFFRVLWIPRNSSAGLVENSMPNVNLVSVLGTNWQELLIEKDMRKKQTMPAVFTDTKIDKLFELSSIRYIVLTKNQSKVDGNLYYWTEKKQIFEQKLSKLTFLKRTSFNAGGIVVFENKNYRQHLYITSEKESLFKEVQPKPVSFRYINPTKYEIDLKNIKSKTYLNFSESYDGNWKLYPGTFTWIKTLDPQAQYREDMHIRNDATLNSFIIDPVYIKKNLPSTSYNLNADGSLNVHMTLVFKPQIYFYLGLLISGITLTSVLWLILYKLNKRKYEKNIK